MKEYLIASLEGFCESPSGNCANNLQVLGFQRGKTEYEAVQSFFSANPDVAQEGFTPEECVAYQVVR